MRSTACGLLLLTVLAAQAGFAQDAATDDDARDDATMPIDQSEADELADIEPAVSSPVLTAEVRRRSDAGGVMDEMNLGRTEITGNQELPKVLYIVPWQKSDPGDLMGRPVNSLLNEVLAPVDRTEFVRQVDYFNSLETGADQ